MNWNCRKAVPFLVCRAWH